jgi:hypothetical protein
MFCCLGCCPNLRRCFMQAALSPVLGVAASGLTPAAAQGHVSLLAGIIMTAAGRAPELSITTYIALVSHVLPRLLTLYAEMHDQVSFDHWGLV